MVCRIAFPTAFFDLWVNWDSIKLLYVGLNKFFVLEVGPALAILVSAIEFA